MKRSISSKEEEDKANSYARSAIAPFRNHPADNHALAALQQQMASFSSRFAPTELLTSASVSNANMVSQLQAINASNPELVSLLQEALNVQQRLNNTAQLVQFGMHPALTSQTPGCWDLNLTAPVSAAATAARVKNNAWFGGMGLSKVDEDPNIAIYQLLAQQAISSGGDFQSSLARIPMTTTDPSGYLTAPDANAFNSLIAQQQMGNICQDLLNDLRLRDSQNGFIERNYAEPSPAQQAPLHPPELNDVSSSFGGRNDAQTRTNAVQDSAGDAATTLMSMQHKTQEPLSFRDFPFEEIVAKSVFTKLEHSGLVADSFFVSIAQMRPCGLTKDDRVGKYKHRKLGFVGMGCKHCGGQPGFGRYFPGSFDSFMNGKNCDGIVKHIASECRQCPRGIREIILELERREAMQGRQSRPRYGSRKRFFTYVWEQLQAAQPEDQSQPRGETDGIKSSQIVEVKVSDSSLTSVTANDDSGRSNLVKSTTAADIYWETVIQGSELVFESDRHLVPDTLLAALMQMRPCQLTEHDRIGRCKDHRIGFVGMCCKHCGGKAGKPGYGRYFPSSIRSLAQVDSCLHVVKHVASTCLKCPPEIRNALHQLQNFEKSERIRYGSRKMFFSRVWARLHGDSSPEPREENEAIKSESHEDGGLVHIDDGDVKSAVANGAISWNGLVAGNTIVTLEDLGPISPAQFAALAQMKRCRLTESDQTGWYKDREVGFGGFCCKHCGGRPSFGRYFPKTVNSFAQTTSSHTIVRHITNYCTDCPEDIRGAVLRLQEEEKVLRGTLDSENSAYGSRKLFYDRVWSRLHGDDAKFDETIDKECISSGDSTEDSADMAIDRNVSDKTRDFMSDGAYVATLHGKAEPCAVVQKRHGAQSGKRKAAPTINISGKLQKVNGIERGNHPDVNLTLAIPH